MNSEADMDEYTQEVSWNDDIPTKVWLGEYSDVRTSFIFSIQLFYFHF